MFPSQATSHATAIAEHITRPASDVYSSLETILASRSPHQVLDFDILPANFGFDESGTPLLRDGDAIGITKSALVQVFVQARLLFWSNLKAYKGRRGGVQKKDEFDGTPSAGTWRYADEVLRATEIILLLHPEHGTVCNWRKRRIVTLEQEYRSLLAGATDTASELEYPIALRADLTFTTSLLRSPLHRHSKSPTLWSHRKWILRKTLEYHARRKQLSNTLRDELWKEELSVALEAAQQHPKNYYAFSHLRCMLDMLGEGHIGCDGSESGASASTVELRQHMFYYSIPKTLQWCLKHPADISSWAFLDYLVQNASYNMGGFQEEVFEESVTTSVDVKRSVRSFAKTSGWQGESLWSFLMHLRHAESECGSALLPPGRRWKTFMDKEKAKFDGDSSI